jgi:hypothetical protein
MAECKFCGKYYNNYLDAMECDCRDDDEEKISCSNIPD